jgi:predicted regulator of Ras-like GTPase activity (Roadblock/LC7/MglB family)
LSFAEKLTAIVGRVEGAVAAMVLGIDGIPIERQARDPEFDIEAIAAELTTLLRRSMQTAADAELGPLTELIVVTERATVLMRPITQEYFLLLALNPGGNVGRARFEMRKAQLALESEFAI